MWSNLLLCRLLVMLGVVVCNPISKDFNDSIRSYSLKEEDAIINSTAKTLQQEELARYAGFAPSTNPIRFKDVPDNALSESHYGRGLVHHDHEHGGYGLHDFDESHYGYGYDYDHHGFDHHHDLHHVSHYGPHFGHGHHGHHHKHLSHHALAAKTILWPLAGLAILGTAAALVTNPVLLQLGVISGRRRRDTTEEMKSDFDFNLWDKDDGTEEDNLKQKYKKDVQVGTKYTPAKGPKKRVHKDIKQEMLRKAYPIQSAIESATVDNSENNDFEVEKFVPVALKLKKY